MTPPASRTAARGRAAHATTSARRWWHPVLVVVLVVVLATAVALVLAQSAGAIHWSILGGNGTGAPG